MSGADLELANLLGLGCSIKRHMLYQLGCYSGGTLLRLAKDLAENNKVVGGDGTAALIIESDPDLKLERPVFRILRADQTFIHNTRDAIRVRSRVIGQTLKLRRDVPELIARNVGHCLEEAFKPLGISDWNSVFWVAHPGGVAYLDRIEEA
ncbi:hypothetical protein V2J09_000341 [Rumex salicifolius]